MRNILKDAKKSDLLLLIFICINILKYFKQLCIQCKYLYNIQKYAYIHNFIPSEAVGGNGRPNAEVPMSICFALSIVIYLFVHALRGVLVLLTLNSYFWYSVFESQSRSPFSYLTCDFYFTSSSRFTIMFLSSPSPQ